jgi:hypothetical protein
MQAAMTSLQCTWQHACSTPSFRHSTVQGPKDLRITTESDLQDQGALSAPDILPLPSQLGGKRFSGHGSAKIPPLITRPKVFHETAAARGLFVSPRLLDPYNITPPRLRPTMRSLFCSYEIWIDPAKHSLLPWQPATQLMTWTIIHYNLSRSRLFSLPGSCNSVISSEGLQSDTDRDFRCGYEACYIRLIISEEITNILA